MAILASSLRARLNSIDDGGRTYMGAPMVGVAVERGARRRVLTTTDRAERQAAQGRRKFILPRAWVNGDADGGAAGAGYAALGGELPRRVP